MTLSLPTPVESSTGFIVDGDITLAALFARTNPDPKKLLAYVRVSSLTEKRKAEGEITVETQERVMQHFADINGKEIVGWVYDLNISGRRSKFLQRKVTPTIQRVHAGEAEGVLVYNVSRWGRSSLENQLSEAMLWDAGGRLLSATEPNDEKTTAGKMTRQMLYMSAEHQSNTIGDSWVAAHTARLTRGLPRSGAPRLGYVYERYGVGRAEYKVDPVTGPLLAQAYRQFIAGKPMRSIATELRATGVQTPGTDQPISYQSLRRSLDSGFGAGRIIANAKSDTPSYLVGAHLAVITDDEWAAYRKLRADSKEARGHLFKPETFALKGLIFCGSCRYPLVRALTRGIFMCNGKSRVVNANGTSCERPCQVRIHVAEEATRDWLRSRQNPEAPQGYETEIARLRAAVAAAQSLELLEAEQEGNLKIRKNYMRMRAAEVISSDEELAEMLAEVDARITETVTKLSSLKRDSEMHQIPNTQAFGALLAGWELAHLDEAAINEALKTVLKGVYVGSGRVTMSPDKFDFIGRWEDREPQVALGRVTAATATGKYCGKCKQYKDVDEFYRNKTGKQAGTLKPKCKECLREEQAIRREIDRGVRRRLEAAAKQD